VKLVVGLGNPGPRYAESRHNVGFRVVDELGRRWSAAVDAFEARFEGLLGEAWPAGQRVLLLKPMTFMNVSGRSVSGLVRFYRIGLAEVIVIYDDLDLPLGQVRLRARGSSGGHRGIDDVIRALGSQEIARVRLGIGRADRGETVDHVLGRFDARERDDLLAAVGLAADAVDCWVREGIETAMNRYNRRKRADDAPGGAGSAPGDET
jgi:PTH1 family peptidyl-tRNA hydrolase